MLRNTRMTGNHDDYLLKIKKIFDTLASIGHTLTPQDHIEAIFNGLSKEYEVFITSVNTRSEPYTVAKIEALLMSQEVRIEKSVREIDIINGDSNHIFGQVNLTHACNPSRFSPHFSGRYTVQPPAKYLSFSAVRTMRLPSTLLPSTPLAH